MYADIHSPELAPLSASTLPDQPPPDLRQLPMQGLGRPAVARCRLGVHYTPEFRVDRQLVRSMIASVSLDETKQSDMDRARFGNQGRTMGPQTLDRHPLKFVEAPS